MSHFRLKSITYAAAGLIATLTTGCASTPQPEPTEAASVAPPGDGTVAGAAVAVPRFEKVPVGGAGFEAYVPKGFPAFQASNSDDGALIETAELPIGDFTFGMVAVKLTEALDVTDDNEALLVAYLDHLKTVFDVADAAGYGMGQRIESAPDAKGVIDYWRTSEGQDIAVKGWITRRHLAIYYISGPGLYPHINVQTMFFEGVRFPAPTK